MSESLLAVEDPVEALQDRVEEIEELAEEADDDVAWVYERVAANLAEED
jgi:hypothetical protein